MHSYRSIATSTLSSLPVPLSGQHQLFIATLFFYKIANPISRPFRLPSVTLPPLSSFPVGNGMVWGFHSNCTLFDYFICYFVNPVSLFCFFFRLFCSLPSVPHPISHFLNVHGLLSPFLSLTLAFSVSRIGAQPSSPLHAEILGEGGEPGR